MRTLYTSAILAIVPAICLAHVAPLLLCWILLSALACYAAYCYGRAAVRTIAPHIVRAMVYIAAALTIAAVASLVLFAVSVIAAHSPQTAIGMCGGVMGMGFGFKFRMPLFSRLTELRERFSKPVPVALVPHIPTAQWGDELSARRALAFPAPGTAGAPGKPIAEMDTVITRAPVKAETPPATCRECDAPHALLMPCAESRYTHPGSDADCPAVLAGIAVDIRRAAELDPAIPEAHVTPTLYVQRGRLKLPALGRIDIVPGETHYIRTATDKHGRHTYAPLS